MGDAIKLSGAQVAPDAWIQGVESAEFKTLAGFARGFLGTKVLGAVNLGFVLIAGNYVMSWVLGIVYARISANRHDPLVKVVIDKARGSGGTR